MISGVTRYRRNGLGAKPAAGFSYSDDPQVPITPPERALGVSLGRQGAGYEGVSTSYTTAGFALVGAGIGGVLGRFKGITGMITGALLGGVLGAGGASLAKWGGREGY